MTTVASAKRALLVLLLANLFVVAWVFRPLAIALFFAAVLAGALWPVQRRLTSRLGDRPQLAASIVLVSVVLLILAPLVALSAFIIGETSDAIRFVSSTLRNEGLEGLVEKLPGPLEKLSNRVLERVPVEGGKLDEAVQQQVSARGGKAVAVVGAVLAGTGSMLFQSAMMLIALFVFLTQKDRILAWIDDASPLATGQTRELLSEFRRVSVAVLRSTVLTAAVQAAVALVGYYIARVPYALFFAAVTFVVAMIPAVGAAAVCLFAAGLLLVTGHPWAAAFLAGWGLVVVGLADNVVKPLLIRHDVELHGAIVFFALLGGLAAFGTVGLLLGPLAVALFVAMLRIYRRDYGNAALVRPDGPRAPPAEPEARPQGGPAPSRLVPQE